MSFDETVNTVFEATKAAVAGDARAARIGTGRRSELYIGRMCADFIIKNPSCSTACRRRCVSRSRTQCAKGASPLLYRTDRGWWFASERGMGAKEQRADPAPPAAPARADNGDTPTPYPDLGLYMFKPVDEASLPAREWLYGRHYQRRTVSMTASPGGTGKTSLVMVEARRHGHGQEPAGRAAQRAPARLVPQRRG